MTPRPQQIRQGKPRRPRGAGGRDWFEPSRHDETALRRVRERQGRHRPPAVAPGVEAALLSRQARPRATRIHQQASQAQAAQQLLALHDAAGRQAA